MSDISIWNTNNLASKNQFPHYPTDMMLRACFSAQYFGNNKLPDYGKVLDIGTLYANNLMPFFIRGWECYGTEVTSESVAIAKENLLRLRLNATVELGLNSQLPFQDNLFDLLLSMSTLHYEESISGIKDALREYSRVLKPGGTVLIQTVAPKHYLYTNSDEVDEQIFQVKMDDDIRDSQKFVFLDSEELVVEVMGQFFQNIEIARCTEAYPKKCVDLWLIKANK